MDNKPSGIKYVKNTKTSRSRTVRLEVVGEVNEAEKHFLDGISFFVAGTMSTDDTVHTTYVAQLMAKLIKHITLKIRKDKEGK